MSTTHISTPHDSTLVGEPAPAGFLRQRVADYLVLTKARLSALVLVTVGVGFLLADGAALPWTVGAAALLGPMLAAFGVSILNQWWEHPLDASMERTRDRPIPSGRVPAGEALGAGLALVVAGTVLLAWSVNLLAAGLALLTGVLYVLVYTPLKRVSPLSLFPGAIVGALPPLIGWTAASGRIDAGGWSLFAILFVWQLPHFMAIDWYHREDYARGTFRTVAVTDPSGATTGWGALLTSVLLIPASLSPLAAGLGAGALYAAGAVSLGLALCWLSARLLQAPTRPVARRLFLATLVYLPLLLALLVLDSLKGVS